MFSISALHKFPQCSSDLVVAESCIAPVFDSLLQTVFHLKEHTLSQQLVVPWCDIVALARDRCDESLIKQIVIYSCGRDNADLGSSDLFFITITITAPLLYCIYHFIYSITEQTVFVKGVYHKTRIYDRKRYVMPPGSSFTGLSGDSSNEN